MAPATTDHSISGSSFRQLPKKGSHLFSAYENLLLPRSPPSFWALDYFSTCVNGPSFIPAQQQLQGVVVILWLQLICPSAAKVRELAQDPSLVLICRMILRGKLGALLKELPVGWSVHFSAARGS